MGRASLGNPLIVKPEDVITAPEFTEMYGETEQSVQ